MDSLIIVSPVILLVLTIVIAWHLIRGHGSQGTEQGKEKQRTALRSVNYHFTRKCNYECGFCFHTAKTSFVLPIDQMKRGLKILADAGMKKLNLSGGEPFLYPERVGEMIKYCKQELHLESTSIVSNGSKIKESFFQTYGQYLDILAVSVDSFVEETNKFIGRGKGNHLPQMRRVADWCRQYNVLFKVNTVVNIYNWEEDMNAEIASLSPKRWKCFQVLLVDTENAGPDAIRNAERYLITDEQFDAFCDRHKEQTSLVRESNRTMKSSYVILDEYMRFLNKGDEYGESRSILEVPLAQAMAGIDFDQSTFMERGGLYEWSKTVSTPCASGLPKEWEY